MTKHLIVDPARRAEIDAELGPIRPVDQAELEGAADPHTYERLLVRAEDARRNAIAAGVEGVPGITLERVQRGRQQLLSVMSKSRSKERSPAGLDTPATSLGGFDYEDVQTTPHDATADAQEESVDPLLTIEGMFGDLTESTSIDDVSQKLDEGRSDDGERGGDDPLGFL